LANSQVVYAWWDDRLGGQQIFAQNLCENGNLGPVDNSFTYYPDTVFFQTSQDVEYGKSFSLVNPHSYSLDIQYIQQEGTLFGSPETWYTRPHYSSFPVTMDPNETVTDTVHWVVLKKSLSGYFYDTLEVRSLTQTSRIIIAIDSSLVITGVPDIKGLNVQAFPNPFPDWIRISGQVQPGKVTISVFNTLMQPVRGPVEIAAPGGRMEWRWDRTDDAGQRVPSGIYFITVKSAEGSKTFRVIAI
ncbi:MAG TPA: T9SS type A sorting domain-containing protein, partial [Bacteroidales bacterium]|nr:T9SS type A sorting domain-containing protein [Bacteroidales bacterium]